MFLKLMDANADTIETHFALGALYRRRGEVERAIRIHQNLLAREALAPEHREQALLALAQDYLRAGLLDRAEGSFSAGRARCRGLRASALAALRGFTSASTIGSRRSTLTASSRASRPRRRARSPRTICASSPRSRSSAAMIAAARRFAAPGTRARQRPSRAPRCCVRKSRSAMRNRSSRVRLLRLALAESPGAAAGGVAAPARISRGPSGATTRCSQSSRAAAQSRDFGELQAAWCSRRSRAGLARRRAAAPGDRNGVRQGRRRCTRCWRAGAAQLERIGAGDRRAARARRAIPLQRNADSRDAAFTGIARPASRGTDVRSSLREWSNCAENPL